jgi:predicted amidohydrolase
LDKIMIAGVQMKPVLRRNRDNLDKILFNLKTASRQGAHLIVFPECALLGYVFNSRDAAVTFAETVPGSSTEKITELCNESGVYVIVGLLEIDGANCFNTAVLIGPHGVIGKHRKIHLPFLGVDRFLDRGNIPFSVYETAIGKIGMQICYDCSFPESSRIMTLLGADIIAVPTNWPDGRGKTSKYLVVARAYENKVHVVAVDRVGVEEGVKFIGQSKIVNAWGDIIAEAGIDEERIIYGEVNLADAREKHVVFIQGERELDFIHDRRPEMYSEIVNQQMKI